ncbi:methyltransferase domain-containing protein [Halogeometricum salsisoli]|uniref:methyltransferase domain-containing protein n=1 Tax=Halogeometricum salsisoli TaxID=2950536 RepID=UPI003CCDC920
MSERIVDVGAGTNPDPRATETLDIQPPADHVADLEGKWPFEDSSVQLIVANHVLEHIADPEHFFNEAARILTNEGILEVTVPLGEDAKTDHTHVSEWRFATPEQFCAENRRPWDPEVPFVLQSRRLRVWLSGPERFLMPIFRPLANIYPPWAAHRCYAGELTAKFQRIERGELSSANE